MKKVSIVIPTFNSENTISDCISSILSQSEYVEEIIVVDGLSTDGTLQIIESFNSSLIRIISEEDSGIYDAINKGIRQANGTVVKILNSDDFLSVGSIVNGLNTMINNGAQIVYSDLYRIARDGQLIGVWSDQRKKITGLRPFLHPSWYVASEVYANLGLYRTDFEVASDYEMYLRMIQSGMIFEKCDNVLINYREGGRSSIGFKGIVEVFKINLNYFGVTVSFIDFIIRLARRLLKFSLSL